MFDFKPLLEKLKTLFQTEVAQDTPIAAEAVATFVRDAEERLPALAAAYAENQDGEFLKNRVNEELNLMLAQARTLEVITLSSAETLFNDAAPLIINAITGTPQTP